MKFIKQFSVLVCFFTLSIPSVYAGLESCREPTPDEQEQLDFCSAHVGCKIVTSMISGCNALSNFIAKYRRYFNSSNNRSGDWGNWPNDSTTEREMTPSEREQARRDLENHRNWIEKREREAGDAYLPIVVRDKLLKGYIEKYCVDPKNTWCEEYVREALERLPPKAEAFNSNKKFVDVRGKITLQSPALAEKYIRIIEENRRATKLRRRDADIVFELNLYCRDPLSDSRISNCQQAIEKAKAITGEAEGFNASQRHESTVGKVVPESPALAKQYAGKLAQAQREGKDGGQGQVLTRRKAGSSTIINQAIQDAKREEEEKPERERMERERKAQEERVAREKARVERERQAAYEREEARKRERESHRKPARPLVTW